MIIIKLNTDKTKTLTRDEAVKLTIEFQSKMRDHFKAKGWPTMAEQARKSIDEQKKQTGDK